MARPSKVEKICFEPTYDIFVATRIATSNEINHFDCRWIRSNSSYWFRKTYSCSSFQTNGYFTHNCKWNLYELARYKIAKSLVHGLTTLISGGNYQLFAKVNHLYDKNCPKMNHCINQTLNQKGVNIMRIAVTYNNGEIFQHSVIPPNSKYMTSKIIKSLTNKLSIQMDKVMVL